MTDAVARSLHKFRIEGILGHKLKVCACHEPGCIYCDGGLASCVRCGAGEIELQDPCAERLADQLSLAQIRIRDLTIKMHALAKPSVQRPPRAYDVGTIAERDQKWIEACAQHGIEVRQ